MGNRSIHEIVMIGGGQLPSELSGYYSGLTECMKAFERYKIAYAKKPQGRRAKKKIELSDNSDV